MGFVALRLWNNGIRFPAVIESRIFERCISRWLRVERAGDFIFFRHVALDLFPIEMIIC